MKKTILQYMTDIYQEDIPKHILQENKIRLNSFFLEQESVQKKGTQFIGEFYQFNLSSCIRQQNSLTAQFVSFSLSNLANIFYPPQFLQ